MRGVCGCGCVVCVCVCVCVLCVCVCVCVCVFECLVCEREIGLHERPTETMARGRVH